MNNDILQTKKVKLVICDMKCQINVIDNRPSSSYLVPLFQSESKCENHSYENEFDLHENEPVGGTHFHMVSHLDSF